jgi:MoaA/NifB/PqqE/SkfB family radical SAM enzyme
MEVKGFHIEATNICTLKCAGCARTQFIQKWPQHWHNHSVDINQLMQFLDCNLTGKIINFCGNYGDPIYHPDFVNLVKAFKQRGSQVIITTNGSYKSLDWWNSLCDQLNHLDSVRFSIDGLPENFTLYRKNADWNSIKIGIKTCVARGIKTIWKFIPFAFNDTQIKQAQAMAHILGAEFVLDYSDRFDEHTNNLRPSTELMGQRIEFQAQVKQGQTQSVDPECYRGQSYYITATGHFTPCCYIADHRFYYKTDFGKNSKFYNISNNTFSQLISKPTVVNFYNSISHAPVPVCQFNCPKLD